MADDIKIARIKARQVEREAAISMARDILNNPVIELIGGFTVIQYMLHNPKDDPILKFGDAKELLLETGIMTAVAVQQLAPSLPVLSQGASNIAGSLAKLIPALGGV